MARTGRWFDEEGEECWGEDAEAWNPGDVARAERPSWWMPWWWDRRASGVIAEPDGYSLIEYHDGRKAAETFKRRRIQRQWKEDKTCEGCGGTFHCSVEYRLYCETCLAKRAKALG